MFAYGVTENFDHHIGTISNIKASNLNFHHTSNMTGAPGSIFVFVNPQEYETTAHILSFMAHDTNLQYYPRHSLLKSQDELHKTVGRSHEGQLVTNGLAIEQSSDNQIKTKEQK